MAGFVFFQAEDGIRDIGVTGVQTCALPILSSKFVLILKEGDVLSYDVSCGVVELDLTRESLEIGRASCRERV